MDPTDRGAPGGHFLVFRDEQHGAGRDFVFLELTPLVIQDGDLAVPREHDILAGIIGHHAILVNRTCPPFLARVSLSSTSPPATPPMWNVRIVNCVPGSPILWAAMMPTAIPSSTIAPVAISMP